MINFHKITLDDRELFLRYIHGQGVMNCDMSFANIFCWQDTYHSEIAEYEGFLLIRFAYGAGETGYMQPIGSGDRRNIVLSLADDAEAHGSNLRIVGLTKEWKTYIESAFPNEFAFSSPRSLNDYIYLSSDLAYLRGGRFQPKRNHVNRFKSQYEFRYEELTSVNMADCMALNDRWVRIHEDNSTSEQAEQSAIQRAFASFEELRLQGGVLYADNNIAAFTYGSAIDDDIFCTHVEKADSGVEGAGAVINQMFALSLVDRYRYINREEDLGIEGLRFSKLSYHPTVLLEKVSARKLSVRECRIRDLWETTFGDERDFVDTFLMHHHNPKLCLTREKNGCVVAMLHIIPIECIQGRVAYIYAVATASEYRRRGYASVLLDDAIRQIETAGNYDYIALIPSGDDSKRLYAAHGFSDVACHMTFSHEFDFGTGDTAKDLAMIRPLHKTDIPQELSAVK